MSEHVNSAIATFAEAFNRFQTENHAQITALATALEDRTDEVDTLLDDYAAELKSALGASAANAAGDDAEAQEVAIAEAEEWVTDNVSNGTLACRVAAAFWLEGLEAGEAALRDCVPVSESVTVRLTLDVTYALNGENAVEMASCLRKMCERAIGEGLLTGETDAEVQDYSITAAPLSQS